MRLVARCYDPVELDRVRSELEQRRIRVLIDNEFTFAIPGMPGAEQPRGILVSEDDHAPAARVVADLLGAERVIDESQGPAPGADQANTPERARDPRLWLAGAAALALLAWWLAGATGAG